MSTRAISTRALILAVASTLVFATAPRAETLESAADLEEAFAEVVSTTRESTKDVNALSQRITELDQLASLIVARFERTGSKGAIVDDFRLARTNASTAAGSIDGVRNDLTEARALLTDISEAAEAMGLEQMLEASQTMTRLVGAMEAYIDEWGSRQAAIDTELERVAERANL